MHLFTHIGIEERVHIANNLAVLLGSGVSLDEALVVLAEESDSSTVRNTLTEVKKEIENGTSLSEAFHRQTHVFGTVFVSMVRAGEGSGTLQGNLTFLASLLTKSADLRREVKAATLYPKMVLTAAFMLGGGLALFILPRLTPLFSGLHVELPFATRVLMAVSEFIELYWYVVIFAVVILVILALVLLRVRYIRRILHGVSLRVPFIGTLLMSYHLAFITQLLATLMKSGIPLNESIDVVCDATTNLQFKEALEHLKVDVEKGDSLSSSMSRHGRLFPRLFISVVSVGERSGTLVDSFAYLSESYSKDVSIRAKKLPVIIEPILLIFIAGIVGFVALSIIMPIYELTGSITTR